MQKKSFLIKDILQKLNEDDSLQRNQQTGSKLVNESEVSSLERNLKKIPTVNQNQLLYDWQSFAMAAMAQNTSLFINPRLSLNWNKFNILGSTLQDKFNCLNQSKLKNYFQFNNLQTNAETGNYQNKQLNYLVDENSNSSLDESSKFSDCDSNLDKSDSSSLISIEDLDDRDASSKHKDHLDKKVKELRKEEKKKRKNRRNRTVFTELQLMGLERRFDSQKYLSTPDRAELANALGLSQLQVKTWYQNRRMKWKKQVMQGGCLVAPTKPKGRPRKGSIPLASSLGITFDTTSLLSAVEARKNNLNILNKEVAPKINFPINYDNLNESTKNHNNSPLVSTMSLIINKDHNQSSNQFNNQSSIHNLNLNEINQEIFNKANYEAKKPKLTTF